MIRPARDDDLEQTFSGAFVHTTELRDAAQESGNVRNIAQLVRERRSERLIF